MSALVKQNMVLDVSSGHMLSIYHSVTSFSLWGRIVLRIIGFHHASV